MSNLKELAQGIPASVEVQSLRDIAEKTGNLYKSIAIIGKRANQVSSKLKEELHAKLEEFATSNDNLEEVFENREQIEISEFYERMPNPSLLAFYEFMQDKTYYRVPEEEVEEANKENA